MNKSESIIEIWKPVKGYEGKYEISSHGNVRSINRIISGRKYQGKDLAIQKNSNGYEKVTLYDASNYKNKSIHRLVAENFISNLENKRCVNHIDGDKTNNNVSNLEWATHSENAKHAFSIGIRKISPKNHKSKIEASVKVNSKSVLRSGGDESEKRYSSITEASKDNNVNGSDITQVCKGRRKRAGGFYWSYTEEEASVNA